jgi:uncharacterized protein (DUF2236 family)
MMEPLASEDRLSPVTANASAALLDGIAAHCTNPTAGVFGPDSISWRVNRESAVFLGAGRAALLQLAHPWVTTALEQHSALLADPIARFHNTFRVVFTMVFGSLGQALGAARGLFALHGGIRGAMTEDVGAHRRGSPYQANEVSALRWVHATLVESAVLAYECVLGPLAPREREAYYEESKTLAALCGIPGSAMPADWDAFAVYCRAMAESDRLGVSDAARSMARSVLSGAGSWIRPPRWYRALTAMWLPERLRREFALQLGDGDRRAAERAARRLPGIYRRLPRAVRFVGPWHEAQARLGGRRAGVGARLSNRFWIGQPRMPFS